MLLTEQKVRRVIRKTIRQNNYRINERFYRDLNDNLIQEGVISAMKNFSKKHGVGIVRSLALIAALGALAPSSQSNQMDKAVRAAASQMLDSGRFKGEDDLTNMSTVQDIAAGEMGTKEALKTLRAIQDENEFEGLIDAAGEMGVEIEKKSDAEYEDGGSMDVLATAIRDNISFEEAQYKVDMDNL